MPWAPIPVLRVVALAYLLTALERNAEAETAFRRVFELAPRGSTAWFNLGFLCE
jgi:Flp pilus assembly protein TadD